MSDPKRERTDTEIVDWYDSHSHLMSHWPDGWSVYSATTDDETASALSFRNAAAFAMDAEEQAR